ncbi:MAG: SAM-dependent methyltransferase [Candidatus Nanohaloarchaea archaeon]|nr:SAM-dependent methyltransferase [Candidatus Nanohaloarchaea archaeon]
MASIPFDADTFDAVYTTMTFHEIPPDGGLPEIGSVLEREGRFVVVDWSAEGTGRSGPPLAERYTVEEATTLLEEYGFTVERAAGRPETFLVVARNRAAE